MEPQWLLPTIKFKWGIGHDGKFPAPIIFSTMFKSLIATMFATKCLPIQAVCNNGVTIPKKNMSMDDPTQATEGTRTIHVYSAFTQNVMKVCQRHNQVRQVSHSEFGAIKHRRREEAIAIQLFNGEMCARNGYSYLTKCFDVKNAFYCPTHEEIAECYETCPSPYGDFFHKLCKISSLLYHVPMELL